VQRRENEKVKDYIGHFTLITTTVPPLDRLHVLVLMCHILNGCYGFELVNIYCSCIRNDPVL